MKTYRIAFIPGDGVGPEVASEAKLALEACARKFGFDVKSTIFDWNCDYYLANGRMMPNDGLEMLRNFDAVFLGSVGNPAKVPDHISLGPLLAIRQGFNEYVNLRPIRMFKGVSSPVSAATPQTVDFVVVRENTEGEYSHLGGIFFPEEAHGFATQMAVFSRKGCERVIRYAYELARREQKTLTSVSKANALNYSMVFWDQIFEEMSQKYPDVETHKLLVDAAAMFFVKKPQRFQVVVTSNLFGDILTDLKS